MSNPITTQTLIILREHLTPLGELPGQLLTDDQIRGLRIFRETVANTALVSFTAIGPDYLWPASAAINAENIANVQRVVRAHIAERIAATAAAATAAAQAASSAHALASGDTSQHGGLPQGAVFCNSHESCWKLARPTVICTQATNNDGTGRSDEIAVPVKPSQVTAATISTNVPAPANATSVPQPYNDLLGFFRSDDW